MALNPFEVGPALLTSFSPDSVLSWCSLSKDNARYCEREYFLSAAKKLPGYDVSRLWFTYPSDTSDKPKLSSNKGYYLMCAALFTSSPSVALNFVHYLYAAKMAIIYDDLPAFVELFSINGRGKKSKFGPGGEYLIKNLCKYGRLDWLIHMDISNDDFNEAEYIEYIYEQPNIVEAYEFRDGPYDYYSRNFEANLKRLNNVDLFPDLLSDNGLFIYYSVNGDAKRRQEILKSLKIIEPASFPYLSVDEAVTYKDAIDPVEMLTWVILDNHWNYFVGPYFDYFFRDRSLSDWNVLWFAPIALNITKSNLRETPKPIIDPLYYHYYQLAVKKQIKFNTDDATYWQLAISLWDSKYRDNYKPVLDYNTYYASEDPAEQKLQELSLQSDKFGIMGKYYNLLYTAFVNGDLASDVEFVPQNLLLEKYKNSYIMGLYNTLNNDKFDFTTLWKGYASYPNSPMADIYVTHKVPDEGFDMSYVLITNQNYNEGLGLNPFNKLYSEVNLKEFLDGNIPEEMNEYPQFVLKAFFRRPEANHLAAIEYFYENSEAIPEVESKYWLHYAPLIDDDAFEYLLPKLTVKDLSNLIPMTFALASNNSHNLATLTQYILEKMPNVTLPVKTYIMYQSAISPVWKSFASQVWTGAQIDKLYTAMRADRRTLDITLNYMNHDTYF